MTDDLKTLLARIAAEKRALGFHSWPLPRREEPEMIDKLRSSPTGKPL